MFVLVAHFLIGPLGPAAVPENAVEPLAMLADSPDCHRLYFAHSTDAAERFVLVAEFDSAASYRKCISPWPMRTIVIPWLSTAEQVGTEVSEVLFFAGDGQIVQSEPTVPEPGR